MEVYSNPATRFVAGFIGSPAMNFLKVELSGNDEAKLAKLGDGSKIDMHIRVPAGGSYELGIRPEAVRVTESEGTTSGKATVVEHLGATGRWSICNWPTALRSSRRTGTLTGQPRRCRECQLRHERTPSLRHRRKILPRGPARRVVTRLAVVI